VEDLRSENSERKKKAEERITNELANQAGSEPNSPENEEAKKKRGQAERDIAEARNDKP
jgi:hypothetical protein